VSARRIRTDEPKQTAARGGGDASRETARRGADDASREATAREAGDASREAGDATDEPGGRGRGRTRAGAGTEGAAGPEAADTVAAALERASRHGRRAASEALLAARALLDALSLALHGAGPEERRILGLAARALDDVADALAGGGARPGLLAAVADALDAEIGRWEARARRDGDARAVLRAYLGLREILWELGVRPAGAEGREPEGTPRPDAAPGPKRRGRGRGGRVQRVPVEG